MASRVGEGKRRVGFSGERGKHTFNNVVGVIQVVREGVCLTGKKEQTMKKLGAEGQYHPQ